jgi:hypothetical protein
MDFIDNKKHLGPMQLLYFLLNCCLQLEGGLGSFSMNTGPGVGRTSSLHYYYLAFVVLTYLAYLIAVNTSHRSFGYYKPGHTSPLLHYIQLFEESEKSSLSPSTH